MPSGLKPLAAWWMSSRQCSRGEGGREALETTGGPQALMMQWTFPIRQCCAKILDFDPEELGQSSWPATLPVRVKQAIEIFSSLGAVFVSVLEIERFIIRYWVM